CVPLDRGTPLVHVPLDRGGRRLTAGVREPTRVAGGRGRELAQRALPGAASRGVYHLRPAIPQVSPPTTRGGRPPVGPPRAPGARRQSGGAVPDAGRPDGCHRGQLERLA